ncbi:autoinducer binding domain-containing protein [Neisseriaceae bacterium TC5R-5]|nr:autoinducer binding domain-containing protein [Neisseriaceae bacterium TC5R-5]
MTSILEEKRREASYDVMTEINRLKSCRTKTEVAQHVKKIVQALGAESFVYALTLPPGIRRPERTFYYLIGCDIEFCRIYARRQWFRHDPFLHYAYKNTPPQQASMIVRYTPEQVEMAECGANHGLRSGLLIPTHSHLTANERVGLLYIGSSQEPALGEPLLVTHRAQFAALALALSWWWCRFLKRRAMKKLAINAEELTLLSIARDRKMINEMAELLKLSPRAVSLKLKKIRDKLKVKNIQQAVVEAKSIGLVE